MMGEEVRTILMGEEVCDGWSYVDEKTGELMFKSLGAREKYFPAMAWTEGLRVNYEEFSLFKPRAGRSSAYLGKMRFIYKDLKGREYKPLGNDAVQKKVRFLEIENKYYQSLVGELVSLMKTADGDFFIKKLKELSETHKIIRPYARTDEEGTQ